MIVSTYEIFLCRLVFLNFWVDLTHIHVFKNSKRKRIHSHIVQSIWHQYFLRRRHKDPTSQHNLLSSRHHFQVSFRNYLTSWYNYLTIRHYFLSRRYNILEVNIIIWKIELIIWMIIFYQTSGQLPAKLIFCVHYLFTIVLDRFSKEQKLIQIIIIIIIIIFNW